MGQFIILIQTRRQVHGYGLDRMLLRLVTTVFVNKKREKKKPRKFLGFFLVIKFYFLLSVKISFAAPKLLKVEVASKGINTLFASPFATSFKVSNDFS